MERYKRGAVVTVPSRLSRWLLPAGWPMRACVRLAGSAVHSLDETKHFKLIGTTGTGKSTAIAGLMRCAAERGDRAVIADPDGGFLARLYDRRRGDAILNPFEPGSVRWDPFGEIRSAFDTEQLARALIAESGDPAAREWRGYARTFVSCLVRRCHELGRTECSELWRLLAIAPAREVRRMVAGTAAQPYLEPENARMFGSIRSVTGSALAALDLIQAQQGPGFSVRQWVGRGRGWLFIPYRAEQIAALRSIIAAWLRLAIFAAMSRAESDLRLWFVIDELDALGAIDGLRDALARLRKFGGRCVIGFQSLAQVHQTYGREDAQTIVENCGNTLILRCSGGADQGGTAQFASRLIGEREILRRQIARGRDRDAGLGLQGGRRSMQISEQHVIEAAVMPSEIEQLPDLVGFLKTASSSCWKRVRIAP